ncbi:MAG: amidase [Burkholderiaceae bacterium]|nr:amidase [Burkholderiaceae bacterium]
MDKQTRTDALCRLSATELRRRIGTGEILSIDVIDACLATITDLQPALNAFTQLDPDDARRQARAIDERIASGAPPRLLEGVPVAIKDETDAAGYATTYGTPRLRTNRATQDADVVARLRSHGAVILGKTNLPELSAGVNTDNPVFGKTRNPYDTTRTVGGSSGGSAAALAAGMIPLATGSDAGGSLRIPAAFCGVASLRPTPGAVPSTTRTIGFSYNGVKGPMARSVADVALMFEAMVADGFCGDPLALDWSARSDARTPPADLVGLRIARSATLGGARVSNAVRELFDGRTRTLLGAMPWADAEPEFGDMIRSCYVTIRGVDTLAGHGPLFETTPDALPIAVRRICEEASTMSAARIAAGYREQTRLIRLAESFFDHHDLLLAPVIAAQPWSVDLPYPPELDSAPVGGFLDVIEPCCWITLLGCPVVTLPCGLDDDGLPFGIQLIGRPRSDRRLLAVATALEGRATEVFGPTEPPARAGAIARRPST